MAKPTVYESLGAVLKAFVIFLVSSALSFTYLILNSFEFQPLMVWFVSISIGLIFTTGCTASKFVRCTLCVTLIHSLSGLGALALFMIFGWTIAISPIDEAFAVYNSTRSSILSTSSSNLTYPYPGLSSYGSTLHQMIPLPLLISLVYSGYVVVRQMFTKKIDNSVDGKAADSSLRYDIINYFYGWIGGIIAGASFTLGFCLRSFEYEIGVLILKDRYLPKTALLTNITFIFILLVVVICVPLTQKVLKIRDAIVTSYYPVTPAVLNNLPKESEQAKDIPPSSSPTNPSASTANPSTAQASRLERRKAIKEKVDGMSIFEP